MSMLASGKTHVDPNNIPLASLVAQEEHVDVNFIRGACRLFNPPEAKTLKISPNPPEKFRRRRHIEAKFRGTEVSVPAPCRDKEVPPEGSPSTPLPSSSPLLTPMMRSELFSLGFGIYK